VKSLDQLRYNQSLGQDIPPLSPVPKRGIVATPGGVFLFPLLDTPHLINLTFVINYDRIVIRIERKQNAFWK
jgi:hypothetical protein